MKIFLSPEYNGAVYRGLDEGHPCLMDTIVLDTQGLVGQLEARLGLHVEPIPAHRRTAIYYHAMQQYMQANPENILSRSFRLSGLGTAREVLRWRDALRLDRWRPTTQQPGSKRLAVVAGIEPFFEDRHGLPDRLFAVMDALKKNRQLRFDDWTIVLPCDRNLLHPAIKDLLKLLTQHEAKVAADNGLNQDGDDNLSIVRNILTGRDDDKEGTTVCIELNPKDDTLRILHFHDEAARDEWLAHKGNDLGAVWINPANKGLDNWLRMMGKPAMGSAMFDAIPNIVQLFVLGIGMQREPLDIKNLTDWLYTPVQPLGRFFGRVLAEQVIQTGGYRNDACRETIKKFIEGQYEYRDPDSPEPTEEEQARRKKHRQQLVDTWLPPMEPRVKDGETDVQAAARYVARLGAWARSYIHNIKDAEDKGNWLSQLNTLADMCDTFQLLIDNAEGDITSKDIDSWITTIYKGGEFPQYAPQIGARQLISNEANMVAVAPSTVWLMDGSYSRSHLDLDFLYPAEKESIASQLTAWNSDCERKYNELMSLTPFTHTGKKLTLVYTDIAAGERAQKHPLLIRLEKLIINFDKLQQEPALYDEPTVAVKPVDNAPTEAQLHVDHPEQLRWPSHLSPTVMSTLISYPYDFVMERMLGIQSTGPGSIADIKTTMGNVAHGVIERLFSPRDGERTSSPEEIKSRIEREYDSTLKSVIDAKGAILHQRENLLNARLLSEQLRGCLDNLLGIISENRLQVTGCERFVAADMGLLPNSDGKDIIGYIDMTLEDSSHHPVIFDFKWTGSRHYYQDTLKENKSIQLELYRHMLQREAEDAVDRVAYFLMPEGNLYSLEHFEGRHCVQIRPENDWDLVDRVRNSFAYRKDQIDHGTVELGDAFALEQLDYFNETEGKELLPLKSEGGIKTANIFSNYNLFKKLSK